LQSLKSDALEPTRADLAKLSPGRKFGKMLPVYGLPMLAVALIVLFSLLFPTTFPTAMNFSAIIENKAVIALLALAVLCPMITGKIDLTIGYGIVLWHILVISLQVRFGLPWLPSVMIVLVLGAVLGLINGLLVEIAMIDSFIATLGMGTILYALALWHTGGRQVVGELPAAFTSIDTLSVGPLPITALYVAGIGLIQWLLFEHMPIGRAMYAIGANPRAALLNGISVRRYVIFAFMVSGTLTAATGVVLAAKLQIGQASVGLDYLLPALVGVFLGSTTVKPGRVNVWGTVVAVIVLAVGISGIQQFGGDFYIEPLFNGATLLASIAIAGYAQRRRRVAKKASTAPVLASMDAGIQTPKNGD
jgi:ribose transport system permease protein